MRIEIAQKNLLSSALSLERISSTDSQSLANSVETSGWSVDAPATFVIDESSFLSAAAFNLKVTNSTETDTIIRGVQSSVAYPYVAENLIFHAMMFCEKNITVSGYLHKTDDAYTTVTPNTQNIIAGRWTPAFSNEYLFGDDNTPYASVTMTIVIETETTLTPVFFTLPVLTLNEPEKYNQFSELSKTMFPDIFRDVDIESTNPSRPLAKIYHSMTADLSQAMDKYVRMTNFERSEINHGSVELTDDPYNILSRSELTDPDLMTPEYLEWGAMLRGAPTLSDIQSGGVSVFDASFDFRRWQVKTGVFGHNAGSKTAVKEAVKTLLSGSRAVLVTPLWEGEQFEIMIRTLVSETPNNPAEGQTSNKVLAVAEPTRPAGFVFLHETVDEINFILNDPDFGVFNINDLD